MKGEWLPHFESIAMRIENNNIVYFFAFVILLHSLSAWQNFLSASDFTENVQAQFSLHLRPRLVLELCPSGYDPRTSGYLGKTKF